MNVLGRRCFAWLLNEVSWVIQRLFIDSCLCMCSTEDEKGLQSTDMELWKDHPLQLSILHAHRKKKRILHLGGSVQNPDCQVCALLFWFVLLIVNSKCCLDWNFSLCREFQLHFKRNWWFQNWVQLQNLFGFKLVKNSHVFLKSILSWKSSHFY